MLVGRISGAAFVVAALLLSLGAASAQPSIALGSTGAAASRIDVLGAGLLCGVAALSLGVTERQRADRARSDLAARLIRAQEDERRRIGRELHDHVSQAVAVLAVRLGQLRADAGSPVLAAALDDLLHDTTALTLDIHHLAHGLHATTLDHLGLVPAMRRLVSESADLHHLTIDFTAAGVPSSLSPDAALCLYRIAEEALTNVARHSGARAVRARLTGTPDGLQLFVEDDGRGFDGNTLRRHTGLGIVSMRERLRALGGTCQIESAPAHGTRVTGWIPAASLRAPGGQMSS